jgi:hypothetical protein
MGLNAENVKKIAPEPPENRRSGTGKKAGKAGTGPDRTGLKPRSGTSEFFPNFYAAASPVTSNQ